MYLQQFMYMNNIIIWWSLCCTGSRWTHFLSWSRTIGDNLWYRLSLCWLLDRNDVHRPIELCRELWAVYKWERYVYDEFAVSWVGKLLGSCTLAIIPREKQRVTNSSWKSRKYWHLVFATWLIHDRRHWCIRFCQKCCNQVTVCLRL